MKITIARCAALLKATIVAAAVLCGLGTAAGVSQASGGDPNHESCVSSVEYACPPPPVPDFPEE
jgi:hypothetical protein